MYLKKFEVKNFKNFKREFTFDLSDVRDYTFNRDCVTNDVIKTGIIYGKNSIGKTNFGLAIFDITYHLVDKMRMQDSNNLYTNADSRFKQAKFNYHFDIDGKNVEYKYGKTNYFTLTTEELIIDGESLFSYDFEKNVGQLDKLKSIPELADLTLAFREKTMSIVRFIANNSNLDNSHPIKKIVDFVGRMLWFRNVDNLNKFMGFAANTEFIFDYVCNNDYIDDLNKFLKDNGVNEVLEYKTTPDKRKVIYFKHKTLLPFSVASSGTKALITFYYWYKHFSQASFVFIDEFDAFYHFELAEKVVKLATAADIQVFFTSHNTNLLSNRIMRPDCYFILTKDKLTSFANATKRELREGHNLEKLFISGEFGE